MFKRSKPDFILLGLLCFALFIVPMVPANSRNIFHTCNFGLVLLACTFCLTRNRKIMTRIAFILVLLLLAGVLFELEILYGVFKCLTAVFFVLIVASLISQTIRSKEVTTRVIVSSINGYLLLGIIISLMVALLAHFRPGSYNFGGGDAHLAFSKEPIGEYAYYAFTAMTTVGYGDLLPISSAAKALSVFASISGQLYLTILVAMLVGKFVSTGNSSKT